MPQTLDDRLQTAIDARLGAISRIVLSVRSTDSRAITACLATVQRDIRSIRQLTRERDRLKQKETDVCSNRD